jgi:hypothetical protein
MDRKWMFICTCLSQVSRPLLGRHDSLLLLVLRLEVLEIRDIWVLCLRGQYWQTQTMKYILTSTGIATRYPCCCLLFSSPAALLKGRDQILPYVLIFQASFVVDLYFWLRHFDRTSHWSGSEESSKSRHLYLRVYTESVHWMDLVFTWSRETVSRF